MTKVVAIDFDNSIVVASQTLQGEKARIVSDILGDNEFNVIGLSGPFDLKLALVEHKYVLNFFEHDSGQTKQCYLPVSVIRSIMKDYAIVCDSYFSAVKNATPDKVEAIDMGRRSVHNEGSEIIQDYLDKHFTMDFETARKVFSLLYVIYQK